MSDEEQLKNTRSIKQKQKQSTSSAENIEDSSSILKQLDNKLSLLLINEKNSQNGLKIFSLLNWIEALQKWSVEQIKSNYNNDLYFCKSHALYLNIERFKLIDNNLGRILGNPLLIKIAQKIATSWSNISFQFKSDRLTIKLQNLGKAEVSKEPVCYSAIAKQSIFEELSEIEVLTNCLVIANTDNWEAAILDIAFKTSESTDSNAYGVYYVEASIELVIQDNDRVSKVLLKIQQQNQLLNQQVKPDATNIKSCAELRPPQFSKEKLLIYIESLQQELQEIKQEKLNLKTDLNKITNQANLTESQLQNKIIEHQQVQASLIEVNQELKKLIYTDSLTQIANRRQFDDYLRSQWQKSRQNLTRLSLILCDIDYFKLYNDTYGHLIGDYCLQQVALSIESVVDADDGLAARYGGEEFGIILPNIGEEQALTIANEIRLKVKNLKIEHQASPVHQYVTLSLGVYSLSPESKYSPELMVALADKALYEAKKKGRDCACVCVD
ncbi:GGDEF domain-containing protein [Myxosarcina sp. GI1]|uniref:GGDEF domain-containing protein n=1 Tax=Myxosarcina sp. GI1 TaxID=1541065 RepID=UPI0006915121|nr:GGDEF domain-containing protein [Myxosarcina sp. GI1]